MSDLPAFPLAARIKEITLHCRKGRDAKKMKVIFTVLILGQDKNGNPTQHCNDIVKNSAFDLKYPVGKREIVNELQYLWEQVASEIATKVSSLQKMLEEPDWRKYDAMIDSCLVDMDTIEEQIA